MDVGRIVAPSRSTLRTFNKSDARSLEALRPASRMASAKLSRDSDRPRLARVARATRAAGISWATVSTSGGATLVAKAAGKHRGRIARSARRVVGGPVGRAVADAAGVFNRRGETVPEGAAPSRPVWWTGPRTSGTSGTSGTVVR